MRHIIVLAGLSFLLAASTHAQDIHKTQRETDVPAGATVVLQLEGDVVVTTWEIPSMEITTERFKEGRVFGYSNLDEREAYDVEVVTDDGHIVVRPIARPRVVTIGISTRRERVRHFIQLQRDVSLIVETTDADVAVNGYITSARIENEGGRTELNVPKRGIRYLSCEGRISLNGESFGDRYESFGDGEGVYVARAEQISLRIQ